MARTALAFVLAASLFVLAGAAQAKAPLDGIDVCGPAACAHLAFADAEQFWQLSHGSGDGRPAPAPYYVARWHWAPAENESAYVIPAALAVRWNSGNGHPSGWSSLAREAKELLTTATLGVEPYAPPTLTRVTVGGRVAQDPQSYLALLSGKRAYALVKGRWFRVRFESATPTPWTDGSSVVRLSRRMPYVQIDGFTYRIPRAVAVNARKALALG
jgi:hypothetical protein